MFSVRPVSSLLILIVLLPVAALGGTIGIQVTCEDPSPDTRMQSVYLDGIESFGEPVFGLELTMTYQPGTLRLDSIVNRDGICDHWGNFTYNEVTAADTSRCLIAGAGWAAMDGSGIVLVACFTIIDSALAADGCGLTVTRLRLNEREITIDTPSDVVSDLSVLPTRFELHQNYPNPFNPSTVLGFSLPTAQPVTLSIINIAGQQVGRIVCGVLPAGYHEVTWDGTDVASGVYFYRLESTAYRATRKMLLLK